MSKIQMTVGKVSGIVIAAGGTSVSLAALLCALSSSVAYAEPAAKPAQASDKTVLSEIVITAEKRNSTVQKTPISITAISGKDLQIRGISGIAEALQEVPGVTFASAGPGQTQFEIRGLSQDGGESPTVGFYLDETPITPPATSSNGKVSLDPDLYDLSRVEVLRGPQGTLYGAGAMGGTIKLVTNAPDPSGFHASGQSILSGTEGGGINYTQNVMVNAPFADDKAAVRLVGTHAHTSGWIDRIVVSDFPIEPDVDPASGTPGPTRGNVAAATPTKVYKNTNQETLDGVRASVLLQPIEPLTITAGVFYQQIKQDGPSVYDSNPGKLAHYQPFDIPEPFSDQFTLYSLTANYDLSWMRITSATSYLSRIYTMAIDSSEAMQNSLALPGFTIADGGYGPSPSQETDTTRQFSQELRFSSAGDGAFQWLTGLFYSKFDSVQDLNATAPAVLTQTAGVTDLLFRLIGPTDITQKAWFGNASYQFPHRIKLTAGLRYFSYTTAESTAGTGLYYTGGLDIVYTKGSAASSGLNPMINLSYTPTDNVMVYTTAAKGFREGAGNFPIPTDGPPGSTGAACLAGLEALGRTSSPLSYGPDTVWSYEVGAKSKLFDQRLTLNGDVYDLEWNKVQEPVIPCCLAYTDNVGNARVQGAELEAVLKLTPEIRVTQNVGYSYGAFTQSNQGANIVKGQRLLNSPNWTVSSAIEYRTPLSDDNTFIARISNSYESASLDVSTQLNQVPGRDITNLRFTVLHGRGNISGSFFIDNVLGARVDYADTSSISFGDIAYNRISTNQPRTFGVNLSYGF